MSLNGNDYWMISLPLKHRESHEQRKDVISQDRKILNSYIRDKLSANEAAEIYNFEIPEFKIGNLDSLVTLSDQLVNLDPQLEGIYLRLVNHLKNLLSGSDTEKMEDYLLINGVTIDTFIQRFSWNRLKYRTDESATTIIDTLVQEALQVENMIKSKINSYNQAKNSLNAFNRKRGGSLLVRDLDQIINRNDLIGDSEYLDNLFVIVKTVEKERWLNEYETLSPLSVVSRSARLLAEEDDFCLYSVIVLRKNQDAFEAAAKSHGFVIRKDFVFDEERKNLQVSESGRLDAETKNQWSNLIRLIRTNFGEVFGCWIHLKVVRLYVESVLRYGLPPVFSSFFIKPLKSDRKVRKILLHAIDKLDLPGISPLELTAALIKVGGKDTRTVVGSADVLNPNDAAEEAELWHILGASENSSANFDPFVNLIMKIALK